MRNFDIYTFGNISLDIIKTVDTEYSMTGGSVLMAAWVAHQLGYKLGILTKIAQKDIDLIKELPIPENEIDLIIASETTSIKNYYTTADKERRICTSVSQAEAFEIKDFPEFQAKVIEYCGLMTREIDLEIIKFLSTKGKLAIDAQGLLRHRFPDQSLEFKVFPDIQEAMKYIHYFKADAAEAEFITKIDTSNEEGRIKAAHVFLDWGAKEVIISHNQALIAATNESITSAPYKNRSLDGRTGRGDTSFSAYITERFSKNPAESIKFAAALCSLKMEIPGPFKKTRKDVEVFIQEFY
jgi:sugar/nucleoside kinase (ribokinase family)